MEIKSGDIVKINSRTFWICDCNDSPLNNLNSEECNFCNCKRPTTGAVDLPNESRQPSWADDGLDDAVIGSLP